MKSYRASAQDDGTSRRLEKRLLEVASEFEMEIAAEKEKYENAIVTLHDKVNSLRTALEVEKSKALRFKDSHDALQQKLAQYERNGVNGDTNNQNDKIMKEMDALKSEVSALRFQLQSLSERNDSNEETNPDKHESGERTVLGNSHTNKLFHAAAEGDIALVKELLTPNPSTGESARLAYIAVLSQALASAISGSNSIDTVVFLLTGGADPFLHNEDGWSAVHHACANGYDKVLEKLLSFAGSNQSTFIDDVTASTQDTALHLAARQSSVKCIKLLLRQGANVTLANAKGQTAMNVLESSEHPNKANAISALSCPTTLFWSYSMRANRLYAAEDFAGAKAAYEEAIQLAEKLPDENIASDANRSTLYYNMARSCVKTGHHVEAVKLCSKAIDLRGGRYTNAMAQRAASHMALFDYTRAATDYETLSKQNANISSGNDEWQPHLEKARDLATKAVDHYHVLGVHPEATAAEIKQSFRKQCLKWHPDKHRGSEDDAFRASMMFKAINEANEILNNEQKRTLFDIDRISRRMDDIVKRQSSDQKMWDDSNQGSSRSFREPTSATSADMDFTFKRHRHGGGATRSSDDESSSSVSSSVDDSDSGEEEELFETRGTSHYQHRKKGRAHPRYSIPSNRGRYHYESGGANDRVLYSDDEYDFQQK